MKKRLFLSVLILSLAIPFSAGATENADNSLRDNLVSTLQFMHGVYRAEYAPAQWKHSYENWDLDAQINTAIQTAQAKTSLSQKDAQEILKNFIYSMKDYHTSISFSSTETASLPFMVKSVGDRYFIVYINRDKLSQSSFPYQIGDELMSLGGISTAQAVAQVQGEIPANIATTDKALAELYLTQRSAARGYVVPQGPVMLEIKSQAMGLTSQIQLIWEYTPEKIRPLTPVKISPRSIEERFSPNPGAQTVHLNSPMMNVRLDDLTHPIETPYDLGARVTFTPALGAKIWESDPTNPFNAYIYKAADDHLYGYIRIPSYDPDDTDKAAAEFQAIIARFQQTTDGLVIDQVNNPGGSVIYLYSLASMLAADKPLTTPLHQISITQADVSSAIDNFTILQSVKNDDDAVKALGGKPTADGYPVSYEFARFLLNEYQFTVDEWNAGRNLSNPTYIEGVEQINPAPTHYTKPILLLVNHLDFSGGDFFPATMQDNKRVKILGGRTAGAGGYVNDVTIPNDLGIKAFRVTESIAKRVSDNPIENLGVTPDVPYEMTVNDYTQNYVDYLKAIQSNLSSMVK